MELTDEVLRDALIRLNEIEMSQVPSDDDIDIEFSDEFERKM